LGIFVAVMVIFALCRPVPAFAVSTLTISSEGDGVFLIKGIGIEDAAAIEIIVSYDVDTLANPRAVEGPLIAGAMTAINPNVPGTVRMAIIRLTPVKGSGVIATITFDRKGSSSGKITAMQTRLANAAGATLLSQAQVTNPSDASAGIPSESQTRLTAAGTALPPNGVDTSGKPSPLPPAVIIAEQAVRPEENTRPSDTTPSGKHVEQLPASEDAVPPAKETISTVSTTDRAPKSNDTSLVMKEKTKKIYTQKSILERFQEYHGQRTAKAFITLFDQESMIGYRQDPSIALSDGKTTVTVTVICSPGNLTSSDVEIVGAKLLFLSRDMNNTNTWIIKLAPKKGVSQAGIAVSKGEYKGIYPLTIAPKVNIPRSKAGKVTTTDVDRYLQKHGTSRLLKSDLNGDSKWDYKDDYILIANYLATAGIAPYQKSD